VLNGFERVTARCLPSNVIDSKAQGKYMQENKTLTTYSLLSNDRPSTSTKGMSISRLAQWAESNCQDANTRRYGNPSDTPAKRSLDKENRPC
jgi:hypothetical protein